MKCHDSCNGCKGPKDTISDDGCIDCDHMIFNGTFQKCLKQNSSCPGKTALTFALFLSFQLTNVFFLSQMVSTTNTSDRTIKSLLANLSADSAIHVAQSVLNMDSIKAFVPSAKNINVENNVKMNAVKINMQMKKRRLANCVMMSARNALDLDLTTALTARTSRSSTIMFLSRNTTTQPSLTAQLHACHHENSKSSLKSRKPVRERVVLTVP